MTKIEFRLQVATWVVAAALFAVVLSFGGLAGIVVRLVTSTGGLQ